MKTTTRALVIGGGVATGGTALLVPLRPALQDKTWGTEGDCEPTVEVTKLGNDAGYIGAASLAKAMVNQ